MLAANLVAAFAVAASAANVSAVPKRVATAPGPLAAAARNAIANATFAIVISTRACCPQPSEPSISDCVELHAGAVRVVPRLVTTARHPVEPAAVVRHPTAP